MAARSFAVTTEAASGLAASSEDRGYEEVTKKLLSYVLITPARNEAEFIE
jgi:hypothetical protein